MPISVSQQQRDWVCLLSCAAGMDDRSSGGVGSTQDGSLGLAGQALVSIADGNWGNARDAISRSELARGMECTCLLELLLLFRCGLLGCKV